MPEERQEPFGSFFTAGRRVARDDSYVVVDSAYVQFHYPHISAGLLPVLFVHGGGLSGALWERTPDGRSGWASIAARRGRPVFVLDAVDGGRSGQAPHDMRDGELEWKSARQIWTRYRIGLDDDWSGRSSHVGSQFPVAHLDELVSAHVPRRRSTDAVETRALIDAIRRIGRCHVIAHSHGGTLAAAALPSVEEHVATLVLVEPAPLDPSFSPCRPTLLVWGDNMETHGQWSRMQHVYLGLTGVDRLALPREGIPGNSHVPMCDLNSSTLLDLVLSWIDGTSG